MLYYITPQVWAWRRGRVQKLVERADRLAVVLPFEAELFARAGERAAFVGHPLLDKVKVSQARAETLARHQLPSDARLLALLPGSRPREVRYLLPPMVDAARILHRQHDLVPCLALAHTLDPGELSRHTGIDLSGIHIIQNDTYSIVGASEVALVASGTATLETALLGCPMVIAYKMSTATYVVAKMLVTGVKYIGMPNILAGGEIVPELIQWQVSGANLAAAAARLLREPLRRATIEALSRIRGTAGRARSGRASGRDGAGDGRIMRLLSPTYMRLLAYMRRYLFPYVTLTVISMLVLSATQGAIPFLAKDLVNQISKIRNPCHTAYPAPGDPGFVHAARRGEFRQQLSE